MRDREKRTRDREKEWDKMEVLHRAQRRDDKRWVYWNVYGVYTKPFHTKTEAHGDVREYDIIPETNGQYTGLEDKNGKKIFEGDIVTHFSNYLAKRINKAVTFEDGSFMSGEAFLIDWVECGGVNVIGSIHDNPELLKQ